MVDSRLVYADMVDGRLHCEFCGTTDSESPLTLWDDGVDARCRRRIAQVPPIRDVLALDVN